MIAGLADENRAVISLPLRGPDVRTRETLEFTLDTGLNGFLSVPGSVIASLRLPQIREAAVMLADGSVVEVPDYAARVEWNDVLRDIQVLVTGGRPLLGTRMLSGHELVVRFVAGGDVSVRPLT